jgi:predicted nucleotidyltransferase
MLLALAAAQGAHNVRVFGSAAHGLDNDGSDLDRLINPPVGKDRILAEARPL